MNDWPPDAPSPMTNHYRLEPLDTPRIQAELRFQDRYGEPPQHIFSWRGWWAVGPIPLERYTEVERA